MSTQVPTIASTTGMFARGPRGFAGGMSSGLPSESDFDLPHPRIPVRVMLLMHQVLQVAFAELRRQQGSLAHEIEDAVTIPLCRILENDLRHRRQRGRTDAIPGFDDTLMEAIVPHAGTTNHDGTQLKNEPDILFKLRAPVGARVLHSDYAIFVECKPVDKKHPVGKRYCDDGLIRFVKGDYAWAMKDALMIGFSRHKRTIASHLIPALEEKNRRKALGIATFAPALKKTAGGKAIVGMESLHVSTHRRDFEWLWNKGPACPIRVYHSWHDCS